MIIKHYYPPSYYLKEHPSMPIRLTKELKEMLDKVKGNMICSDIMRKLLTKDFKEIYEKGYSKGYEEGYKSGKNNYTIWYYCAICGKLIDMTPNDNDHKVMIECMKKHRWGVIQSVMRREEEGNCKVKVYSIPPFLLRLFSKVGRKTLCNVFFPLIDLKRKKKLGKNNN